jgi:hypothetical protein
MLKVKSVCIGNRPGGSHKVTAMGIDPRTVPNFLQNIWDSLEQAFLLAHSR